MKVAVGAMVVLLLGAMTTGAVVAQGARAGASEKAASKQDRSTGKKLVRSVSGSVRASSNEAVVVVGRDKAREVEWTFAVEPTTHIRKAGKSIVGADLKPGDAVQVRFSERDGRAIADAIVVRSPKKTPPPKK